MDIQFRKGTEEYLDSCIKAMEHSSMCTAYFQSEESRANAVMEGIHRGTLYFIAIKEEYRGKGIGKKLLTIQMQRFFMRN